MSRIIQVVLLLAVACGGSSAPQTVFNGTLSGANETPANTSTAKGTAQFTLNGNTMSWTASTTALTGNLSGFHIHLDTTPGASGPVVVTLTSALKQNADKSTSGSGTFTAPDANAKNADGTPMTFDSLVTAMRSGKTYVNVHDTPTFGGGEIRGQLVPP
jgi:Cu/Zn superoxide dismutase